MGYINPRIKRGAFILLSNGVHLSSYQTGCIYPLIKWGYIYPHINWGAFILLLNGVHLSYQMGCICPLIEWGTFILLSNTMLSIRTFFVSYFIILILIPNSHF